MLSYLRVLLCFGLRGLPSITIGLLAAILAKLTLVEFGDYSALSVYYFFISLPHEIYLTGTGLDILFGCLREKVVKRL